MLQTRLYERADELPAQPREGLAARPRERSVLLVAPTYFNVSYAINPHMERSGGGLQEVDEMAAREQWRELRSVYEGLGFEVEVIPGQPELPDMVFAANQSFPFVTVEGNRRVVMSRMATAERRPEVASVSAFYEARGFGLVEAPSPSGADDETLEGSGDLLWLPNRRLVFAGFGFRSHPAVLKRLPEIVDAPIIGLRLTDPAFYHLDVALSFLDEDTALWHPPAFDESGRELLRAMVPQLIELPAEEAGTFFAGNAHSPDEKHVLIDAGATATIDLLRDRGFEPVPLDTSEFRKAGGSVFCLKSMLP